MRKQQIHKELEQHFGDRLYRKDYDYELNESDLYILAEIFIKYIFRSKFSLDLIEILPSSDVSLNNQKGDCSFGNRKKPSARYLIRIFRHPDRDNFFQIANVLAHELIHVYDYEFGKIQNILKAHCTEQLSGFYVVNVENSQYVGQENYNPHGRFFLEWADKFNKLGFDVSPTYNVNRQRKMKKLSEEKTAEKYDFFYETDDAVEMLTYKTLKHIFDCIDTPGKKFVFRSSKEWFISIP